MFSSTKSQDSHTRTGWQLPKISKSWAKKHEAFGGSTQKQSKDYVDESGCECFEPADRKNRVKRKLYSRRSSNTLPQMLKSMKEGSEEGVMLLFMTKTKEPAAEDFARTFERQTEKLAATAKPQADNQ